MTVNEHLRTLLVDAIPGLCGLHQPQPQQYDEARVPFSALHSYNLLMRDHLFWMHYHSRDGQWDDRFRPTEILPTHKGQ